MYLIYEDLGMLNKLQNLPKKIVDQINAMTIQHNFWQFSKNPTMFEQQNRWQLVLIQQLSIVYYGEKSWHIFWPAGHHGKLDQFAGFPRM